MKKRDEFIPKPEEELSDEKDKKITNTAFLLMFPAFLITGIAAMFAPVWGSILAILLAIYQFIMLRKFIETYYDVR